MYTISPGDAQRNHYRLLHWVHDVPFCGRTQNSMKILENHKKSHVGLLSVVLIAGWTAVIILSLLLSIWEYHKSSLDIARHVARTHIEKDLLFRNWNSTLGSVYIPVTDATPPNLLIDTSIVPDRDITTKDGRQLTLLSPHAMIRQAYDYGIKSRAFDGNITTLGNLRKEAPHDSWEGRALRAFEEGSDEESEVVTINGTRVLHMIKPFITEENCLRCHASQGYKRGEIRGWISINLPLEPFESTMYNQKVSLLTGHIGLWVLGVLGIWSGLLSVSRHIDERNKTAEMLEKANELLLKQANTDILTGIANRQKGTEQLILEIQRAERYGTALSLIMFDLDRFKQINDVHGHDVGDKVLTDVATRVATKIRASDLVARWGGEEFIVIVPGTNLAEAFVLAEKLRSSVEQNQYPDIGSVTCSFGVATFHSGDTPDKLVKRADETMYQAKRAGRNRVELSA